MHRSMVWIFGWWLTTAAAVAQTYPAGWNLAHPNAKALMGADVRAIRQSAVAKELGAEFHKASLGTFPLPGLELFDEIDRILISSPGAREKQENPPFLVIVSGHFTPERLAPLFLGKHRTYRYADVFRTGIDSTSQDLAVLDDHTIVLGDSASLDAAIDRYSQGAKNASPLVARAAALASSHDLWLLADISPSQLQPAGMNLGAMLSAITGLQLGVSVRDGVNLELSILTRTPKAAEELRQRIADQLHAAMEAGAGDDPAADFARRFEIAAVGHQLRLKLRLSQAELDRKIRTFRAAAAAPRREIVAKRSDPPRTPPKLIRIYGLDEGVREVPLDGAATRLR